MTTNRVFYTDLRKDHEGEFFDYLAFPSVLINIATNRLDDIRDLSVCWHVWDNEWPVLVVDPANLRLGAAPPPHDMFDTRQPMPVDANWLSFKWFITEMVDKEISAWWEISREEWQRTP